MDDMNDDFAGNLVMAWHANGGPRAYNPNDELDAWRMSNLEMILEEDLTGRILSITEAVDTMSYFIKEADGTGSVVLITKAWLDDPQPRNQFGSGVRYTP